MNNWRWDNPRAFGDQVDRYNLQANRSGKAKRTGEHISWYGSDDLRAKIEPPSCRQFKPGDFLAIRPLIWDVIISEDDDDDNWTDHGASSGGRCRPADANDNDDVDSGEDTQGCEKQTRKGKETKDWKGKGKATMDGKGKGKGKRNGNSKGKGIVKNTPEGDDISRAMAVQLQQEMYEADSDTEGSLERVSLEPVALPTMSISSDHDTDSTENSDSDYNSEHDSDVDMRLEDDVDAPDGIPIDGKVDMETDGDDDKEEDDEEEDREVEDEEEMEEEDEGDEEDKDEDDPKDPRTIGQRQMVNTSPDDANTKVDNEPTVLPEQGQDMRHHAPRPQPPEPAAGHKPQSIPHNHELPRLIPSVCWRFWGCSHPKNLAQRRQLCKKLIQPETPCKSMWSST
jgi:hypothetical protein